MEIIGRQIEFGVATEASRGVAEATADRWMRKVTANVVEKATHVLDDTTRGVLEDGEARRVVQKYIEGDVEGILHIDLIGWLFANIYGSVVTATVEGTVKSHTFSLKQNIQHQSLTLFAKDGSVQQQVFSNAMINTLQINASIDDYVRFSTSFVASAAADNTDTPSYETEYDFVARDITIKIADTEVGLTSATALKTKDMSITWDQGTVRDHVFGAYNPDDIYNAKLMIEGSFTLNFTDKTFKELYLGNDAKYMSIVIEGEEVLSGTSKPKIEIILNKVQFMDWNRSGDANSLVTEPINFRAFYNATDKKQSTVKLQNVTSAYTNVPSI